MAQGQQGDTYRLTRQNALETLSINDVSLEEDGIYRCYTLFEDDYEYFNVTVLGTSLLNRCYSTLYAVPLRRLYTENKID